MGRNVCGQTLRHVRTLFSVGVTGELADGQLLERFKACELEDAGSAFAVLVERHGPMVLRACRAVLRNEHDAYDAFQVVFLVLLRKVGTLRVRGSLGPWLHQVALRIASSIRSANARRSRHEQTAAATKRRQINPYDREDLSSVLHEEIDKLPEHFRKPVVLCCLEGLSREQAARHLGWPLGTVQSRLARGRERLRASLTRRGLGPPVVIGTVLSAEMARAAVPSQIAAPLIESATQLALGKTAVAFLVPVNVIALTEGALKTMIMTRFGVITSVLLVLGVAATGAGVWATQSMGPLDQFSSPREQPLKRPLSAFPDILARVNGTAITRDQLIERCMAKHGAKELESLIGMTLLREACRRRGIAITDSDIDAEVAKLAKSFGLSVEDWYGFLSKQRGISKDEYLTEVVPARIMERKLGIVPSDSTFEGFKQAMEKLDGKMEIQTHWPSPSPPAARDRRTANHSQEDRLRDVERKLDSILKSLDGLKRDKKQPKS